MSAPIIVLFEIAKYNGTDRRDSMDYMTLKEASEKWGISPRMINYYCTAGRITGTVKMASVWLIPKNTEKPADGRRKEN